MAREREGKKPEDHYNICRKKHFIIFNTLNCRKLEIKGSYLIFIN